MKEGFEAILNIAGNADNTVVMRDHIGTLVSILEYRREDAEVINHTYM